MRSKLTNPTKLLKRTLSKKRKGKRKIKNRDICSGSFPAQGLGFP